MNFKYLAALLAFILVASPVFAANIVLNPSFESTQADSSNGRNNPDNLTIPLDWFLYDYNPDGADQAAWAFNLSYINTTDSFDGTKSIELVEDAQGVAVSQAIPNITNGFYLEFYVKIINGTTTLWNFQIGAAFPDDKEIHINSTGGIDTCYGSNFTCSSSDAGNGWHKINATLTEGLTGSAISSFSNSPLIFLGSDGVGDIGDSILLDNVILNPTSPPTPPVIPPTGLVTGATASVYVLLPVIFGILIILYALNGIMSGNMEVKEAGMLVIVGIIMMIVASAIVASSV